MTVAPGQECSVNCMPALLAPDRALPKTVKYGPQAQMAESSLPPASFAGYWAKF